MWFRSRPTVDDVLAQYDLAGRVILVTGADSGIGFETARALAARGARVYVGCLRESSGEEAVQRMRDRHGAIDARPWPFDLGDLAAVRAAATGLPEPVVHALICNAGVYGGPYGRTTNGFERTLGVCYLGHAALTLALSSRLRAGTPARVVLVSSDNHRWPLRLDFDALPLPEARYSELAAYGQAKLCMVMFAAAFDRRHADLGIRAYALHPGDLVSTGIDKDSGLLRLVMTLARPFSPSAAQAAATSAWLATTAEVADRGGRYFVDCAERSPSAGSQDVAAQERLWALTEAWLTT